MVGCLAARRVFPPVTRSFALQSFAHSRRLYLGLTPWLKSGSAQRLGYRLLLPSRINRVAPPSSLLYESGRRLTQMNADFGEEEFRVSKFEMTVLVSKTAELRSAGQTRRLHPITPKPACWGPRRLPTRGSIRCSQCLSSQNILVQVRL
jgi:hypothetical protein